MALTYYENFKTKHMIITWAEIKNTLYTVFMPVQLPGESVIKYWPDIKLLSARLDSNMPKQLLLFWIQDVIFFI